MKKKIVMVTAIVLLIGLLFSMASLVSAGFVEEIFKESCEIMRGSSGSGGCTPHYEECPKCYVKLSVTWECIPGCNQNHQDMEELGQCNCWPPKSP